MRIFIAGASGAVGTALVPSLVESGHTPIAMIRTQEGAARLKSFGATTVLGDGLNRESVVRAMSEARPDVVIHVMTALRGVQDYKNFDKSFAKTNLLRTAGTDNLLYAAREAGVRKFVAHSFAGWNYARDGSAAKRESDPFDAHPPSSQTASLQALIHLERAVLENGGGLSPLVLRCANLYGPNTAIAPDGDLVTLIRKRQMPIVGAGSGIWSFIHVADAAAATVQAINADAEGVFNVADDEPVQTSVWIPELADIVKAGKPMRVPTFVGRWAAGEAGVSMMTMVRGASNAKARKELSWRPRYASWREGFRAVLAIRPDAVRSFASAR